MATRRGIHLNCNKTSGKVHLEFVLTLSLAVWLVVRMELEVDLATNLHALTVVVRSRLENLN